MYKSHSHSAGEYYYFFCDFNVYVRDKIIDKSYRSHDFF